MNVILVRYNFEVIEERGGESAGNRGRRGEFRN